MLESLHKSDILFNQMIWTWDWEIKKIQEVHVIITKYLEWDKLDLMEAWTKSKKAEFFFLLVHW